MEPDGSIDYAVFQLSPRRSRCELLISSNGNTEKLASGLIKPFVTQLKVAEEQFAKMVQCIKLEVGKGKRGETWFTRGTLERFVRFVSTPEILELASSFDAEMSQLEAARKIYLQGRESQHSVSSGEDEAGISLAADVTKKELLRAIDVRLAAVQQQLAAAFARACAAGFYPDSVSELMLFADCFGAVRLNEACAKFLALCQRRPDLLPTSSKITNEQVRSSCESDMSLDDLAEDLTILMKKQQVNQKGSSTYQESCDYEKDEIHLDQLKAFTSNPPESSSFVTNRKTDNRTTEDSDEKGQQSDSGPIQINLPNRRMSVQDRINLFERKQKENFGSGSGGSGSSTSTSKPVVGKSMELRRLSSDVSTAPSATEKAVLRRWSGASDMSIDLSAEKKVYSDSPLCTPSSTSVSQAEGNGASNMMEDGNLKGHHYDSDSLKFDDNILKAEIVVTVKEEGSLACAYLSGKDKGSTVKERFTVQNSLIQQANSSVKEQHRRASYEGNSEEEVVSLSESRGGYAKQLVDSEVRLMGSAQENDVIGLGNQDASASNALNTISNSSRFSRKSENGRTVDNDRPKDPRASQFRIRGFHGHSRSFSGQLEVVSGLKLSGEDKLAKQPRGKTFNEESEEATRGVGGVEKLQMGAEELSIQNMNSSKPILVGSEPIKRPNRKRDDGGFSNADSKPTLSSRKISRSHEFTVPVSIQSEQLQKARQSKGNQELNDELMMKANELEKLFTEHKLRVPNDQSSSVRRSKATDLPKELMGSSQLRKVPSGEAAPGSLPEERIVPEAWVQGSSASSFRTPAMKFADPEESSSTLRRNFSDLSCSDESRGKFYEKYMKRRDAKLREEWVSKRAEKEAKLKAMHDRFKQSKAEMKAKFPVSADRQQSSYTSGHPTERIRSFNGQPNVKEQQMDLNQRKEKETWNQNRSA